jgi:hypothetical protein
MRGQDGDKLLKVLFGCLAKDSGAKLQQVRPLVEAVYQALGKP